MATIVLSILLFLVLFAAMAIGLAFGRRPIRGSCGGMSALAGDEPCPLCGGDPVKCESVGKGSGPWDPPAATGDAEPGAVRRFEPSRRSPD